MANDGDTLQPMDSVQRTNGFAEAGEPFAMPLQIKLATLILTTCLGFLSYALLVHSGGNPSVRTIFVFKLDGTNHCEPYTGVDLDSMELELTAAGIKVFSRRKGYDGREGIAICGTPTGQINIYEIASSDLSAVFSLGFKQLPENWIKQYSGN